MFKLYLFSIVSLFFIISCANIMPLSGGEKDIMPPEIISFEPKTKSCNFNQEKIIIEFDEYIVKNNITKEFFSSPSLKNNPVITIKGKKAYIELNNDLKPNQTYIFNLDNCFKDLNEGNILKKLKYVFSTGENVDSFVLSGLIKETPSYIEPLIFSDKMYVLIYDEKPDSIIKLPEAKYIIKMNNKNEYKIENVAKKEYEIYFLIDDNKNLQYDLGEVVGFERNDTIFPFKETNKKTFKKDTLKQDSIDYDNSLSIYINSKKEHIKIIKLYNEKYEEVQSFTIDQDVGNKNDTLIIDNLCPGKYKIFVFEDVNGNRKIDMGDVINKVLPEKILHQDSTEIRSNWSHQILINL